MDTFTSSIFRLNLPLPLLHFSPKRGGRKRGEGRSGREGGREKGEREGGRGGREGGKERGEVGEREGGRGERWERGRERGEVEEREGGRGARWERGREGGRKRVERERGREGGRKRVEREGGREGGRGRTLDVYFIAQTKCALGKWLVGEDPGGRDISCLGIHQDTLFTGELLTPVAHTPQLILVRVTPQD